MDLLDMEGETERRVLDRSSEREDMEEGELSDADEVDTSRTMAVYSPQRDQATKPRVIMERVGRALPDLLNDIGVNEFNVLDEATTVKLGARAKRFNLDSHITYAEVSRMYETLGISEKDRKPGVSNSWRLETIHVQGTEQMEEEDVMEYFKDYNPLEFCRVDNMSCNVAWGTAANSGKAMLGLSRPIASSQKRKVIHRIASSEEMDQERVVVEEDVDEVEGEKPVDPADIEVAVPQGNWRIGGKHQKAEALFLRFAKVEEVGERVNYGELDARNRSLTMGGGLLSRSKRENLLAARDEQLEREQADREKEIDGKNPWGSIAENWGSGRRREQAREYPIPLEHMDKPPRSFRIGVRDWDAPEDEFDPVRVRPAMEEGGKRKRSIKDRLQMDKRVVDEDYEESEEEAAETFISEGDDDSDIEWTKKRKRPRMGMVADMVEKKNVKERIGGDQKQKKELIKRKIANKTSIEVFEEEEEEEADDWQDEEEERKVDWRGREDLRLSVKVEDRPMLSLTKRLNERFRGGRLAGRLGDGVGGLAGRLGDGVGGLAGRLGDGVKVEGEEREVKNLGEREGRESRRQYSRDVESDGGDSLENDDGEDLKSDFGNAANMVIQVNQSDDETMDVDLKYEENRGRERQKEGGRNDAEREKRERDKRRENEARDKRKEREREREKEKERQREREGKEREREKRKDLERERELERINREKKDQERELSRLKDREREKRRDRDVVEERTKRADKHRERENARQRERERERKDRDRDREREREKERERRREREKDRSKTTSKSTSRKKKDESADESSEVSSDESSSDSESESESSSNSESSSDDSSDDSEKSSSDSESEDDKKKKKGKDAKESSQRTDSRKETSKDASKKDETRERKDAKAKSKDEKKSDKNTEEKKTIKKEKKEENTDDKKKADELRNKLKNYLQAAQAAKEKKKDAEK